MATLFSFSPHFVSYGPSEQKKTVVASENVDGKLLKMTTELLSKFSNSLLVCWRATPHLGVQ